MTKTLESFHGSSSATCLRLCLKVLFIPPPRCASVHHRVFKVDTEVGHCRENICVFFLPVMLHSVSINYVVLLLCSFLNIFLG